MYEPVRELPTAQIDEEDTTYRISSPGDIQKLASSLQAIGLINPPILEQVKAKCRIVCGFKRIQAARLLNWAAVPARVLPPQSSPRKCTQIAVADNSVTRNLDIVEQARALKLLERFFDGEEALIEAGQKINLPLNRAMIEKLRLVNEMKPVLQDGLVTGTISLPIAIRLHHWQDYPAMEVTGRLMNALNMSLNRQREMLDWFEGILSREKTTLHEIFESLDIERILRDEDMDRRMKIDVIRAVLKKRRYPAIVARENHYHELVKKLSVPGGCQLTHPPFFEGNVYSVKIDFRTHAELVELLEKMNKLAQSQGMQDLLSHLSYNQ